ncbi:sun domain-containing protein 1-like [Malaya genurostris]|uniref:sun domain-containing protein 1-like n=1 Tax=Malaya genurostris TaxID=325434 RepID=UPI0026F37E7F|nr:sun domain-containing protein 1-like [Malaya genurostris]
MAIAFYCEDDDPKLWHSGQAYYATIGYNSYQQQQPQQQQHQQQQQQSAAAVGQPSQLSETDGDSGTGVDENNNCVLHGADSTNANSNSNANSANQHTIAVDSNRQLMQVLHQVLYRFTSEGALSPAHTSCIFCNKIYYLFQLLY